MKEITIGEWVTLFLSEGGTLQDIIYELEWVSKSYHERPTREFLVASWSHGVEILTNEMVNTHLYTIRYRISDPQSAKEELDKLCRLEKL